ncbi:hypothetical protein [Xenorhabdus doucetiae]|uniref:Putative lipoprotein n=1 Tax=Xenorhabdus doucetiae TaxID=351671 RepID=A0A068QRY5_9GAMM
MAIGHFLRVGDKTTCGGAILTGTSSLTFYGKDASQKTKLVTPPNHYWAAVQ